MRLHRLLIAGTALGALWGTAALAQTTTVTEGPYVKLEGGWANAEDEKGDLSSPLFSGAAIRTQPDDSGYIAGGAFGYKWQNYRFELGLDYTKSDLSSYSAGTASGSMGGNLSNLLFMVNGYYDFETGTPFVPYVGVGVGGSSFRYQHASLAAPGGATLGGPNGGSVVFAFQPIVGVHYALSPQAEIGAEYRYIRTTDESFSSPDIPSFSQHFESNNVLLSFTWHFNPPAPPPVQPVAAPAPVPPAPPAAAPPPQKQVFLIFFDFDKATLTDAGAQVVAVAAQAFKNDGGAHIQLTGYTDLAGTQQYNMGLSERRADTVKDTLVKDGVPADQVDATWRGKENPRVPTPDGVREPQNRRVEVVIP